MFALWCVCGVGIGDIVRSVVISVGRVYVYSVLCGVCAESGLGTLSGLLLSVWVGFMFALWCVCGVGIGDIVRSCYQCGSGLCFALWCVCVQSRDWGHCQVCCYQCGSGLCLLCGVCAESGLGTLSGLLLSVYQGRVYVCSVVFVESGLGTLSGLLLSVWVGFMFALWCVCGVGIGDIVRSVVISVGRVYVCSVVCVRSRDWGHCQVCCYQCGSGLCLLCVVCLRSRGAYVFWAYWMGGASVVNQ